MRKRWDGENEERREGESWRWRIWCGASEIRSYLAYLRLSHALPGRHGMPLRRPGGIFYDLIVTFSIFYWHETDSLGLWYCVTLIVSIEKHSSPTTMVQTATSAAEE